MRGLASIAAAGLGVALAAAPNAAPAGRIYGAENIKRHLQQHGRSRQQGNSPAGYAHANTREMARRVRQAERNAERRLERYLAAGYSIHPLPDGEQVGLSRRGYTVRL
jgi:hypothetical protein